MTEPSILILAAGQAARMRGTDKLLQPVDGTPQLRRLALAALQTGCPVLVMLPPDNAARRAVLHDLALTILPVADAALGLSATLRRGAAAVPPTCAAMILPADMPELDAHDLAAILAEHRANPTAILRGAAGAIPGHPVLIPADLTPALQTLTGDTGARDLIRAHAQRLRLVPLPGRHATLDLDTPEAWQAWQAARAVPSSSGHDPD